MKLSKLMLAVATLAAGASVFAAPIGSRIAISSGASATLGNLMTNTAPVSALRSLCTAAGGTANLFGTGNFRTMVCASAPALTSATYTSRPNGDFINFNGTSFAELRLNVDPGSFGAVLVLNPNSLTFTDPASPATPTATLPGGAVIVGGLLDLSPEGFPLATIGSNTLFPATAVGIAQTFGVAVSNALYTKMFNAQQTAGKIPAAPTCTVASTGLPFCVPSIFKGQMATIMADNAFNAAYSNGVGFLTGVAADNGTELRYVRRVDTSGTQASAQNYFLGLPCSANPLSIVAEPTTDDEVGGLKDALIGSIRVLAAPGTGDVRTALNNATLHAIGVVSGENNQASQTWKWLRVDGTSIGENATPASAGITNSATMRNGMYDFYFESVYMGGSVAGNTFWATVSTALNSIAAPVGLIEAAALTTGYSKGGQACRANASN